MLLLAATDDREFIRIQRFSTRKTDGSDWLSIQFVHGCCWLNCCVATRFCVELGIKPHIKTAPHCRLNSLNACSNDFTSTGVCPCTRQLHAYRRGFCTAVFLCTVRTDRVQLFTYTPAGMYREHTSRYVSCVYIERNAHKYADTVSPRLRTVRWRLTSHYSRSLLRRFVVGIECRRFIVELRRQRW